MAITASLLSWLNARSDCVSRGGDLATITSAAENAAARALAGGNDVWIGAEAIFLPGVRVGDGAVIGSRAVVTRDVAPYAIVAGNPARQIRRRFDDRLVELLLEMRWWDWSDEQLRAAMPLMTFDEEAPDARPLGERWCAAAAAGGAWLHPHHNWYLCAAHTAEDIERTLAAADRAFEEVARTHRGSR